MNDEIKVGSVWIERGGVKKWRVAEVIGARVDLVGEGGDHLLTDKLAILYCLSQYHGERKKKVYLIGSLRNPEVVELHKKIQEALPHVEVFSSWVAAGPEADDYWRDYEKALGRTYKEALAGYAAKNVFEFDKKHLDDSDVAVLVLPAGRSGHLELGYMAGQGKATAILLDNPDRWDVMYQFAGAVVSDTEELVNYIKEAIA